VTEPRWSEENSVAFAELGQYATPWRDELARAFLALLPGSPDEQLLVVDLAAGTGWLSEAIVRARARSRVLIVDGSEMMLAEAARRLAPFGGRFETRRIALEDEDWLPALPEAPGAIVSSLAVHHLDAAGKQRLYRQALARLAPGGALLLADVVAATSEPSRRYWARLWEDEVRRVAPPAAAERFVRDGWNYFDRPDDPIDRPSPLADQLVWLREIGFVGVDAFWVKAGHALFGGYKGTVRSGE
jgi:SAM-dependent methyltransferase